MGEHLGGKMDNIFLGLVWEKMRMWGRKGGGKIRSDFSGEILLLRMNSENFQRKTWKMLLLYFNLSKWFL